ncbi:MAG: hypothetical protein K2Y71_18895 [Xanthobacteraceae bacterium]|nr:hypothetical protein [Xanthobacteraceae bacterium]
MTNRDPNDSAASRPRSEPEIIPPGQPGERDRGGVWVSVDDNDGPRRVYVARPSPLMIILGLAILGLIAVVMLILLLSVAVIWIPVVIVLIAAFVASMYWQRFRAWLARR